jgi:hypothetical protein
MLNWLLHVWRSIRLLFRNRPAVSIPTHPVPPPYQPSNLHARHR